MRQDGGGQAMLAQRRAQRRADEEVMVADHLLAAPSTVGLRQIEYTIVEELLPLGKTCSDF